MSLTPEQEARVPLNSQDCIELLISAAGGMDKVESWFNWRTFKVKERAISY